MAKKHTPVSPPVVDLRLLFNMTSLVTEWKRPCPFTVAIIKCHTTRKQLELYVSTYIFWLNNKANFQEEMDTWLSEVINFGELVSLYVSWTLRLKIFCKMKNNINAIYHNAFSQKTFTPTRDKGIDYVIRNNLFHTIDSVVIKGNIIDHYFTNENIFPRKKTNENGKLLHSLKTKSVTE